MPKFAFKVLCASEDSCKFVREKIMNEFKSQPDKELYRFDHISIANFNSALEARKKAEDLLKKHHPEILDISISYSK